MQPYRGETWNGRGAVRSVSAMDLLNVKARNVATFIGTNKKAIAV